MSGSSLPPSIWIVIPCAGTGTRMQSESPKQFLPFADGLTLLEHVVNRFLIRKDVKGIVLAANDLIKVKSLFKSNSRVNVIAGGISRTESVFNALKWLKKKANNDDLIAIHDAARPCIRQSLLNKLFAKAQFDSIILAAPCVQTVKTANPTSDIDKTLNRDTIYFAQTPQVFRFSLIFDALEYVIEHRIDITDDAQALETQGLPVKLMLTNSENIKITYPSDLLIAQHIYQLILKDND